MTQTICFAFSMCALWGLAALPSIAAPEEPENPSAPANLPANVAVAQTPPVAQADDTVISPRERAFIASKMYSAIPVYFAHLQTVPDFDLEASYSVFLDAAFQAPGRYEFDLACMEFMAQLHNGHSGFYDPWLYQTHGKPLGFSVMYIENQ